MTDIVERLRETMEVEVHAGEDVWELRRVPINPHGNEAADEIERLRALLDEILALSDDLGLEDKDGETWFTTPAVRVREIARSARTMSDGLEP